MQEGPKESSEVVPAGGSEGHEHGGQQLVRFFSDFSSIRRASAERCAPPRRIYKSKYNDDSDRKSRAPTVGEHGSPEKEKKPRDKSRTRTIFGRKKTTVQPTH